MKLIQLELGQMEILESARVFFTQVCMMRKRYLAIPYAEYEAKTMMCAEALLIEYQKGEVLCDAL